MSKAPPPTLIDEIYQSTFKSQDLPLAKNINLTVLRQKLFQARRFVLDERMSGFLADLSMAAFASKAWSQRSAAVDQLRRGARLPHRITWIEYDLFAESCRQYDLGNLMEATTKPVRGSTPDIEGWLLEQHPTIDTAFRATIFTKTATILSGEDYSMFVFPWNYVWVTDDGELPFPHLSPDSELAYAVSPKGERITVPLSGLATGIFSYGSTKVGINPLAKYDAGPMMDLLKEWTGVVRRMWALLSTINDLPILSREVRASKGFIGGHQYRRFLDHRTITLNVPVKKDLRVVARHAVALARKRAHMVRGHWRVDWRQRPSVLCQHDWQDDNKCRICNGHRLWITEHQRGDASLGVVMTDYRVEHPTESLS